MYLTLDVISEDGDDEDIPRAISKMQRCPKCQTLIVRLGDRHRCLYCGARKYREKLIKENKRNS